MDKELKIIFGILVLGTYGLVYWLAQPKYITQEYTTTRYYACGNYPEVNAFSCLLATPRGVEEIVRNARIFCEPEAFEVDKEPMVYWYRKCHVTALVKIN